MPIKGKASPDKMQINVRELLFYRSHLALLAAALMDDAHFYKCTFVACNAAPANKCLLAAQVSGGGSKNQIVYGRQSVNLVHTICSKGSVYLAISLPQLLIRLIVDFNEI